MPEAEFKELALDVLAGQKLLEKRSGHGVPLYWLTRHEPAHAAIKSVPILKAHQPRDNGDYMAMMRLIMP